TDEWPGYIGLAGIGRRHVTVCHAAGAWARDDDGDGVREVHDNTSEGVWTGVRNFLRPFRGVDKGYLHQYAVVFQAGYDAQGVTASFMRALVGMAVRLRGGSPRICPTGSDNMKAWEHQQ